MEMDISVNETKYAILVSAPLDFLPELKERISDEMSLVYAYGAGEERTKGLLCNDSFDAWLVAPCPTYLINRAMIDSCPSLKIISTPSTGTNHIDVEHAESKGIRIFCLRGSGIVNKIYASSEFTFNLMISTIRKTPYAFRAVCEGRWRESEGLLRARELAGLTLGIIGFGRIGGNVAKYASAFGMRVLAYDPYKQVDNPDVVQEDALDDLLGEADVIVVCVHLNDETRGMINSCAFEKMKDGVYFINTSRGDVIDEGALLKFLDSGKIAAAGVDVISGEFSEGRNDHPLIRYARTHDNLIITPHIAGLTFDSERKAQTAAYEAIREYLGLLRRDYSKAVLQA
jgi:D-3-phosphoglycerate dehydrogenase